MSMHFTDKILKCMNCGADFLFTVEEQQELVSKGLAPHRRYCRACQSNDEVGSEYEGRVKWFDDRKGYGFIEWNGGKEVFVHYSAIRGQGFRTLKEGERVRFRVKEGTKGLQALDVIRVSEEVPSTFFSYSAIRLANPK